MPVIVESPQEENKTVFQLPNATTGFRQGPILIGNPVSNKTEKTTIQEAIGAGRASFDWQVDGNYAIDVLKLSNFRVWKSLQNGNLGHKPSEGVWWTERPISIADGIADTAWASGVFTYNGSKVIVGNIQYYLQTAAPFESSDFATELANGDWAAASGGGNEVWGNFDDTVKILGTLSEELLYTNPDYDGNWTFAPIANWIGGEKEITNASPNLLTMHPDAGDANKIWDGIENASFDIGPSVTKRFKNNGIYIIVK